MSIDWPVLWIDEADDVPQIGTPELEWQGKPLTIPTIDQFTLSMGRDDIATLTVKIPVIVRTRKARPGACICGNHQEDYCPSCGGLHNDECAVPA